MVEEAARQEHTKVDTFSNFNEVEVPISAISSSSSLNICLSSKVVK